MSTNTDLDQDRDDSSLPSLPRIRAPPPSSSSSSAAAVNSSSCSSADRAPPDGDEGCRTPTSSEHRIAPALTCPPAPRKPRRTATRKRARPSEAEELLRKVSQEEIEAFFLSCEPKTAGAGVFRVAAKRTCSCK
ncbi:uncharacterized protein LOC116194141 [Punica granatum]|uniref:Cyclin-dependent protein kinase inhibitor SMR1-like n=2 Tax=Punica granatum TaxID=22663 RepID=A0A218WDW1_PUNGR|nr:uncharacterized protein LOC116194141 [Punica granatum]OWM70262.1 hypothetical protein CDL15_Pgr026112 [Punica granatum]PKI68579.1 hypothetical protein CRG98_011065 [Punica granatum]